MPRQLLRDRQLVEDDWRYADELGEGGGAQAPRAVILGFDQWHRERDSWVARGEHSGAPRLGVLLLPEHRVERLAPDLQRLSLVACSFPGPAEGRGYTQGRQLRERYDFQGELRATGYVRTDQLFFLARCGFNSFELADGDMAAAGAAFSTFTAAYQPANDRGLALKLEHP
jgi:uncharacterized protein (DUF934 family)